MLSFALLLAGSAAAIDSTLGGRVHLATFGALPNTKSAGSSGSNAYEAEDTFGGLQSPATESFNFFVSPHGTCQYGTGAGSGAGVTGGTIVSQKGAFNGVFPATQSRAAFFSALQFLVDDVPVTCEAEPDVGAPCILRTTRQYPYLPTGAIADPMRRHYSDLRATLRYDAINTDEKYDPAGSATGHRFGAVRGLLSLTNTGHVKHHVKVTIQSSYYDEHTSWFTSSGDNVFDNADSAYVGHFAHDEAPVVFTQFRSTCTKDSHHFQVLSTSASYDTAACPTGDADSYGSTAEVGVDGATVTAKVSVPAGGTVIVAGVHEVYQPHRLTLAQDRLHNLDKRHNKHDLHWFADLSDRERQAIVNFCVDDDDADDSDSDDDDDSSASSSGSYSTASITDSDFAFHFLDSLDDPWQDRSHRRSSSSFESDIDSSAVWTSTVGHVSDRLTSSSSSSSSSSHGTGYGDAWFARVKAEHMAEVKAAKEAAQQK